jgi:WD40 repeat protein
LLLAVEARRLSPTAETNGALLTALNDVSRVRRFLNDSAPVAAIALSPDGTTIATGDRRGIISFWRSGPSLSELGRVRSSAAVTAIAFSPDGRRLAAAGTDGRIHEWAVGTRRALTSFAADVGTVLQLRWTASGSRLQSFGADHLLRSFAATTGRSVSITSVAAGTQVTLPVADGPTVLSAGRAVRIMTPSGDRPVQTVVTAPSVVTAGPTAVLVGGPGAVTVSSVSGGPRASVRLRAPAGLGSALPSACAVTDDGTTALVAYGSVVVRYDLASGRQLGEPSSVPGVKTISTLRSHDASTAVAVNTDGRVAVLDLDGSALSSPLTSLGGAVSAIALSPDGKVIAIGDAAGEIQVTDGRTGTTRLRLHSAGRALNALAFSPDGALLADGDGDAVLGGAITGSVSVWRTADGRLLARARVPGLVSVSSVAFSSNRDLALVTAAGAGWQWKGLHSFAPLHVDGADSPVTAVAARPRGALLLALRGGEVLEQRGSSTDIAMHAPSSSDRLAEDAAGKAIVALGADDPLLRTTAGDLYTVVDPLGPVQVGALSDDGSTAAFVSDGLVSLWDVRSRSPIGSALPVTGVTAVAFAADGRHLVTGTSSGDVEVWQISPQAWVAVACRVAARRLTPAEWRTYLLGRAYRPAC